MKTSEITGEFIKLNQWLKKENLASTGGEAKFMVEEGRILLNGETVTEVRKKLRHDDTVSVDGETYRIQVVD